MCAGVQCRITLKHVKHVNSGYLRRTKPKFSLWPTFWPFVSSYLSPTRSPNSTGLPNTQIPLNVSYQEVFPDHPSPQPLPLCSLTTLLASSGHFRAWYFLFIYVYCTLPTQNVNSMKTGNVVSFSITQNNARSCCGGGCCSVTKSCQTLCDPMNCSTPAFPVLHYFPEFAQTHIHWVSDVIQPPQFLSFPSPLALNLSQHQGLFQLIGSSHWVAKVLKLRFQHQSFQWIFRAYFL